MSDEDRSVVSEALPTDALYLVPTGAEEGPGAREKLEQRGAEALTNTELISLIVGSGNGRGAAILLLRHGLSGVKRLTYSELRAGPRTGRAGARRLAAALELHRRLVRLESSERPRLSRPKDAYHEVRDIRRLRKEHLVGLYLDAQNDLVHRETISVGSLNTTRTHPREILYPAIQHLALGFILAHNHPSGCLEPSPEDLEFTRSVKRAGELMGIDLYDHLVVAEAGFTSMRERGLL